MGIESDFEDLYREAWQVHNRSLADPLTQEWLLDIATPVLVFGRWQLAEVATVGINPSDREFLDYRRSAPLPLSARRFLHRKDDDPIAPSQEMIIVAREMMERYFESGRAYLDWFGRFDPFLAGLARPFTSGLACHTDYLSPFATYLTDRTRTMPEAVKIALLKDGLVLWRRMLDAMPNLRAVFGMGRGWRYIDEALGAGRWEEQMYFSDKRIAKYKPPFLSRREARVGGKTIQVFWWKPHRGDPLFGLSTAEKRLLGTRIRRHIDSVHSSG